MTQGTNRVAVATLTLGGVALLSWVAALVLAYIFPPAPGHYSPATGGGGFAFMVLMLLSGLLGPVVLIMAVVAFISVRRSGGAQKGIGFAILGMALAVAPYAFGPLLPNLP
jgi:hypothetical protein